MAVKQIGGWIHVVFTQDGKKWNINTMMIGDHRVKEAEAYELRLRSAIRKFNEEQKHAAARLAKVG